MKPIPSHFFVRFTTVLSSLLLASVARGEVELPDVTGVSNGRVATQTVQGEEMAVGLGTVLDSGLLKVEDNQQIMLFCSASKSGTPSGGMIVVLGPAEIDVQWEENRLTLVLQSGRLISSADGAQSDQLVFIKGATADSKRQFEMALGQGETYVSHTGDAIDIAFMSKSGGSARVVINEVDRSVPAGKRLSLRADAVDESDAAAWLQESAMDFDKLVHDLSIKSARSSRISVQTRLIDNVIAWDKYAQAENIEPEAEATKMEPEIRQVVAAVQNNVQNTTNRGGSPQTPSVQGANEVPSLSPAAVSVGGVTAVEVNNASAANLLTRTQSRGLGFNGPAQLSTPGFLGGFRNVGPSGLGAQKSIIKR